MANSDRSPGLLTLDYTHSSPHESCLYVIQDYIQLMLTICGFHICKFVYSLKFVCNPQISTHGGHEQSGKKSESPSVHVPGWGWTRWRLPSCFSFKCLVSALKCPFCSLFTTTFVDFCEFWWWFHYLRWPSSIMLTGCLVFLSVEGCDVPHVYY